MKGKGNNKRKGTSMKPETILTKISLVAVITFIQQVFLFAQTSAVPWSVFNMGFDIPASSTTSVKSAVGQAFVGLAQASNTRVESGFLVDSLFRGPVVAVGEDQELPTAYALRQNYPNPFNPSTTIRYEIPSRSSVELVVYNLLGQKVATLVNEEQEAGRYSVVWTGVNDYGVNLSSGVYFYRLHAGDFVQTKKLILLK